MVGINSTTSAIFYLGDEILTSVVAGAVLLPTSLELEFCPLRLLLSIPVFFLTSSLRGFVYTDYLFKTKQASIFRADVIN